MYGDISTDPFMNVTSAPPANLTDKPVIPFLNNLSATKIGMAVGLWVSVFIVTLVPFFVIRRLAKKWNSENRERTGSYKLFTTWLSRINCFAAGVFLSTGFMDIFPEMLEAIEEAKKENQIEIHFPLGPFLTLLGFFMILIVEESVTYIKNNLFTNKSDPISSNQKIKTPNNSIANSWPALERENNAFDFNPESPDTVRFQKPTFHDHSADHTHHEHHDHDLDADILSRGNLTVTILMIAISIHSIFEGLALGLEKNTAGASRLFLALCLHKYIIAITIGLQVAKSSLNIKMACFCALIFSFATPFGVVLGFWVNYLQEMGNTSFSMVAAVLQGLACGTFFYIVFFEILPEEFSKRHDKLSKVVGLILGFLLVCVFMYVIQE